MSLKVSTRTKDGKTYLQIVGRIHYPDGRVERIRQAPNSQNRKLAEEEAAALETRTIREAIHGRPRGSKPFAEAVEVYLASATRAEPERDRIHRMVAALGDVTCEEASDQQV